MEKLLYRSLRLCASVGAFSLLLLGLMVTSDVAVRWLSGRPIAGVFEMSQLLLVAAIFLPLGFMQQQRLHIRMDMISARAKGRWAALFSLLDAAAGLLLFSLLLWAASGEFMRAWRGGFRLAGVVEIPTTAQLGLIIVGTVMIVFALVRLLWISLRGIRHSEATE